MAKKIKIHVIRRLCRPDRTAVSGFTAYGCRVLLAGKHTARLASVESCPYRAKLCAQSRRNPSYRKSGSFFDSQNALPEGRALRLDFSFVVAVDHRAVLGNDEGVGVVFHDDCAKPSDFIFGDENVEHVDRVPGIVADAVHAGDAAMQVDENFMLHLGA